MKPALIIFLLICSGQAKASNLNRKLLPTRENDCDYVNDLTFRTIEHFFRDQHSLTMIDFSEDPSVSFFACTKENDFFPVYQFNEWNKVNMGAKVENGGLSAYSKTRGFMSRCSFDDMVKLFPRISDLNPRAKVMVKLEPANLQDARRLLEIGWKHKMLDVGVLMHFPVFDGINRFDTNISLCLLNPFAGNEKERQPEFKCFNITKKDVPFDKIDHFLTSRIKNLQKYPIRVDIFEEVLLSRAVRNGNGMITRYEYSDGDTIEQLAAVMNFTPIYNTDSSGYGFRLPNATFTGSLGAIEYGKADLAAIPNFIADYDTKKSLFLQPIAMKRLFFVFQKRETFKVFIVSIISQLDHTSKVLVACLGFAFPVMYCLIAKIEAKANGIGERTAGRNVFLVIALMTSNSSKVTNLWASRIVIGSILFYTLLFSSLFQGSIIKSLNQNLQGGDIKTVGELLKENYNLIMERSVAEIFHEQGGSELGAQLRSLARDPSRIVDTSTRGFELALANKKVAFLLSDPYIPMLKQFYDDETGEDLFDVLPKPVFEFFVAPMSRKDCPFIETFNFWLAKYQELGLQKYQVGRAIFDIQEKTMIRRSRSGKVPRMTKKPLTLRDLAAIFYVYLVCLGLSLSVFASELLTNYFLKRFFARQTLPIVRRRRGRV